jgi:hypothetical protein
MVEVKGTGPHGRIFEEDLYEHIINKSDLTDNSLLQDIENSADSVIGKRINIG